MGVVLWVAERRVHCVRLAANIVTAKMDPATTTIMPAVLVSLKPNQPGTVIAATCPSTADRAAMPRLRKIIVCSRSVSRCADAAGTISIAITRMLPTLGRDDPAVQAPVPAQTDDQRVAHGAASIVCGLGGTGSTQAVVACHPGRLREPGLRQPPGGVADRHHQLIALGGSKVAPQLVGGPGSFLQQVVPGHGAEACRPTRGQLWLAPFMHCPQQVLATDAAPQQLVLDDAPHNATSQPEQQADDEQNTGDHDDDGAGRQLRYQCTDAGPNQAAGRTKDRGDHQQPPTLSTMPRAASSFSRVRSRIAST